MVGSVTWCRSRWRIADTIRFDGVSTADRTVTAAQHPREISYGSKPSDPAHQGSVTMLRIVAAPEACRVQLLGRSAETPAALRSSLGLQPRFMRINFRRSTESPARARRSAYPLTVLLLALLPRCLLYAHKPRVSAAGGWPPTRTLNARTPRTGQNRRRRA